MGPPYRLAWAKETPRAPGKEHTGKSVASDPLMKISAASSRAVWSYARPPPALKPSAGAGVDTVHSHTPRKVREDTERAAGHDGGPSF
jgi:hypothetical protein